MSFRVLFGVFFFSFFLAVLAGLLRWLFARVVWFSGFGRGCYDFLALVVALCPAKEIDPNACVPQNCVLEPSM